MADTLLVTDLRGRQLLPHIHKFSDDYPLTSVTVVSHNRGWIEDAVQHAVSRCPGEVYEQVYLAAGAADLIVFDKYGQISLAFTCMKRAL